MRQSVKVDRRVLRTRKAIMEAFDRLVIRDGIEKVTVSAIAREADIDRKTFYLHYASIRDLARKRAEGKLERVIETLREQGAQSTPLERVHIVLSEVNAILLEDLEVYQHIASSFSTDQMLDAFEQTMHPVLERTGIDLDTVDRTDIRMRLQFYIAGALSLYTSWLGSDHSIPIEDVSNTIEEAIRASVFPTFVTDLN